MKILRIFATATLIAITASAFSQAQFAIGIKGGVNFANINTNASAGQNYNNRTGFNGGAFALIKLTKIGIQPELLFSQQGSSVKINTQNFSQNYNYLLVPILLKLYTVAGINIQAGPQFGFVTGGKVTLQDQFGNLTTHNAKDYAKSSDFSLALGLGWDLPFGMTIDGRYNLGLSRFNNNNNIYVNNNQSSQQKNQVWMVSVGFKLIKFGK